MWVDEIVFFVVPIVSLAGGWIIYKRVSRHGKRLHTIKMSQHINLKATREAIINYVNNEPSTPGTSITGRLPDVRDEDKYRKPK